MSRTDYSNVTIHLQKELDRSHKIKVQFEGLLKLNMDCLIMNDLEPPLSYGG